MKLQQEQLPMRLSRNQAEPLCRLEGLCERTGECHGDCDCSSRVQEVWQELRRELLKHQGWDD